MSRSWCRLTWSPRNTIVIMNASRARRRTETQPVRSRSIGYAADWLIALTGWRADLAALLAGGLSVLALPPVHAIPALLLTVSCLLCLIQGARRPVIAARRGWWFGFGLYGAGLYWVTEAILFEAARFW